MPAYRVGLIGLGRIASTIDDEVQGDPGIMLPYAHMACYREVPSVAVVAAADSFAEQRSAFQERWGLTNLYSDYREMLARERLDIVSVTTSARPRPGIVADCARAGVRLLYAEKPLAFSLAEADQMLAICRQQGTKVAVGCTRRWDAYWQQARRLIDQGALGRLLQVNGYGRAGISHNGSHLLDLVRYLAGGQVEWVFGEMESDARAAGDDDLMGNGYLAFDNGVRAFVRMWPSGPAEWEFDVIGEQGRLRGLANGRLFEWWRLEGGGRRPELVQQLMPRPQRLASPGVLAVHDLVACLESDKQPTCSGDDGLAVLELAIALRQSHRQGGRRIDLPLADRQLLIRSAETLHGDLPVALRRRSS
jgi:predicted dehydrogenase